MAQEFDKGNAPVMGRDVLDWFWSGLTSTLNAQPSTIHLPSWPRRLVYCLLMRTLPTTKLRKAGLDWPQKGTKSSEGYRGLCRQRW